MKTNNLKNFKAVILAVVIVIGVGYASADWQPAPGTPPSNNAAAPINIGRDASGNTMADQTKYNGLTVSGVLTSINLNATNVFKFNPTVDANGASTHGRAGKVLTALDNNGTVGWASPAGLNAVTSIKAGNNIKVEPCTGDPCSGTGDVTLSADSIFPVQTGILAGGGEKSFGSNWKVIMLSGQQNAGNSDSDAGPAGGYIMKDSAGNITWSLFVGQGSMRTGSGSDIVGIEPSTIRINRVGPNGVTITNGLLVQLAYVVLN